MQGSDFTQLGMAAVVVLLILREVFTFLKVVKYGKNKDPVTLPNNFLAKIDKMAEQINEADRLHSVFDADGRPVWYVKQSLETAIWKLSESITNQNAVLGKIADMLVRVETTTCDNNKKLEQLMR